MDRLEKALQKAREQRENAGVEATNPFVARRDTTALPEIPDMASTPEMVLVEEELDRHRIIARQARSPQADVFRMLRTKILHIMNQSNYRTLAITSPNYGDGKTTIALNLALSLALDVKQTV